MTGVTRRRELIAEALSGGPVPGQERLRALLARRGVRITQATLSRDLRAMGVVRGPDGYALPGAASPSGGGALESALREYLLRADVAGTFVVLRTGPGHAQVVGLELDRAPLVGQLGTIAGDDTIFIAAQTEARARRMARHLKELAGLG